MNPISSRLVTGTLGELLVQARLLCYLVQAAPPLKDSGNDLIAVRGATMLALQIKSTQGPTYDLPSSKCRYHLLAAVQLAGEGDYVDFEATKIFLIPRAHLPGVPRQFAGVAKYAISQPLVDQFFPPGA